MNDLISREALKNKFDDYIKANPNISGIFELGKIIIDKAPTVEPEITNDDLQAAMTESWHLGYELAETKFKRPHGKWVVAEDCEYVKKCSNCNEDAEYLDGDCQFLSKYCPNCGAKMDGEEADNETN